MRIPQLGRLRVWSIDILILQLAIPPTPSPLDPPSWSVWVPFSSPAPLLTDAILACLWVKILL